LVTCIALCFRTEHNGPSNKFIFRATYGNLIVCNIFPA
jgi:hypothetical protein